MKEAHKLAIKGHFTIKRRGWNIVPPYHILALFVVLPLILPINLISAQNLIDIQNKNVNNNSNNDYSPIIDQITGNIFSNEPFNIIRLNGSVILSLNSPLSYYQPNHEGIQWVYHIPGTTSISSFFYAEVSVINALITNVSIPPVIVPGQGITIIPPEIWEMYDNPVNDSVWKFIAPPYWDPPPIYGKETGDEILLINQTVCKLLATATETDIDRVTLSVTILSHPAYLVVKLLSDENNLSSTVPYFSVGAARTKYYSGDLIPLTTVNKEIDVAIPGGGEYQPDFFNFFLEVPTPVLFELAAPVSLSLALPVPLLYYLKKRNPKVSLNIRSRHEKTKSKNDERIKQAIIKNRK